MKLLIISVVVVGVFIIGRRVQAAVEIQGAPVSVYDFTVKTIDGNQKSLADYKGRVLLIVNTASRCGFTPQYTGLETLYERYKDKGFVVLTFPENNFMNQEPGNDASIKKFCEFKYHVSFPLFSKISVKGPQMAPLYKYLTTESGFNGDITWNFNKFLVDRQGRVIERFGSRTKPLDPELEEEVQKALAQK